MSPNLVDGVNESGLESGLFSRSDVLSELKFKPDPNKHLAILKMKVEVTEH